MYMSEIREEPLLTAEQEHALFMALRQGNKAARETLVKANLRLVAWQAKKHLNRGLELLELIEVGNEALLRAVDNFDSSREGRFSSYAVKVLHSRMIRALQQVPIVPLPSHISERLSRMIQVEGQLAQKLDRMPTTREMAEAIGLGVEDLHCIDR